MVVKKKGIKKEGTFNHKKKERRKPVSGGSEWRRPRKGAPEEEGGGTNRKGRPGKRRLQGTTREVLKQLIKEAPQGEKGKMRKRPKKGSNLPRRKKGGDLLQKSPWGKKQRREQFPGKEGGDKDNHPKGKANAAVRGKKS